MKIPQALRQQVWKHYMGSVFEAKCLVTWCQHRINVFQFEACHNMPASLGGPMSLSNLRPCCGSCNRGMGNQYTFDEWNDLGSAGTVKSYPRPTSTVSAQAFWARKH